LVLSEFSLKNKKYMLAKMNKTKVMSSMACLANV
jgi:hypothetical protein